MRAISRDDRSYEGMVSDLAQALEKLRGADFPSDAPRQRLRLFLGRRAEAVQLLLALFEGEDEEGLAVAISALRAMDDPSLAPILLEVLRSPNVSDLAKGLILNLLEDHEIDTLDPSLIGVSIDFRTTLKGPGSVQVQK